MTSIKKIPIQLKKCKLKLYLANKNIYYEKFITNSTTEY